MTLATAELPVPTRAAPTQTIVADRGRAAMLREHFLDPLVLDRPIIVDLNAIHVLTLGAADELCVRWLDRVRSPRTTVVVAFATYIQEVRESVATALSAGRQAAYLIRSLPPSFWPLNEAPEVAGARTVAQDDTIKKLALMGGRTTARQFADKWDLQPSAATNRLKEVHELHLVFSVGRARADGGDEYVYPWQVTGIASHS